MKKLLTLALLTSAVITNTFESLDSRSILLGATSIVALQTANHIFSCEKKWYYGGNSVGTVEAGMTKNINTKEENQSKLKTAWNNIITQVSTVINDTNNIKTKSESAFNDALSSKNNEEKDYEESDKSILIQHLTLEDLESLDYRLSFENKDERNLLAAVKEDKKDNEEFSYKKQIRTNYIYATLFFLVILGGNEYRLYRNAQNA